MAILRRRCADLDLKLLRLMRTRGHTPAVERAARLLGKAGNNGAGWFVAGAALAAADTPRRSRLGRLPRRSARPRSGSTTGSSSSSDGRARC